MQPWEKPSSSIRRMISRQAEGCTPPLVRATRISWSSRYVKSTFGIRRAIDPAVCHPSSCEYIAAQDPRPLMPAPDSLSKIGGSPLHGSRGQSFDEIPLQGDKEDRNGHDRDHDARHGSAVVARRR